MRHPAWRRVDHLDRAHRACADRIVDRLVVLHGGGLIKAIKTVINSPAVRRYMGSADA
jgi:hypothetical protein